MSEARHPVVLTVSGLTCQGCVNAVTRIVRRADPQADVSVDLDAGRVEANTIVDARTLADAVTRGGYEASPAA